MKNAQLYSQIFIYILTILVVSFILVYGYNAIHEFRDRAEKVSCLKLRNDIKNAVEAILSDFGTVKRKDLQLCSGHTQICFVETFRKFDRQNPQSNIDDIDPIVKDSVSSNTGQNTYIIGGDSFYAGNISIDGNDVMCLNAVNGKISLKLEGKGNHALISEWR